MRGLVVAAGLVCLAGPALDAEPLTADEIMRRVAERQERAIEARSSFVYSQKVRARVYSGNGKKLRHELVREYRVAPSDTGVDRELIKEHGTQRRKGELAAYDSREAIEQGWDFDLARNLSEDLLFGDTRDGLDEELYPLSSAVQEKFRFRLDGTEEYRGATAYRVFFEPKERWEGLWEGEALIDADQFAPLLVVSHLAPVIPRWVHWTMGISIRQMGFKVTYEEFDDGVWFPASAGGEFEIRLFHFYKRKGSTRLVNADFQRTDVESEIEFDDVARAAGEER